MATSVPDQNLAADGCCFSGCHDGNSKPAASIIPLYRLHQDHQQINTRQEMKPSEDILAAELNKLSVQERNKALDDLHCVGEDLTETPELIETSLQELDRILKERNEPIYNVAEGQNRAYVEDRDFRLRFLRANYHDAENAANQMIGFLTQKEMYFGRDKIARDITLGDLNEEDMNVLLCGRFHIQDALDRRGRHVVWFFNHAVDLSAESLIRANYFVIFNILSPLTSVQTKGIVVCYYDMSKQEAPVSMPKVLHLRKFMAFMTKAILRALQQSVKVRARVHYGSDMELQYKLRSHGLPMETIPVDTDGNIRMDILNVWFQRYVAKERNELLASSARISASLSVGEGEIDGRTDQAVEAGESLYSRLWKRAGRRSSSNAWNNNSTSSQYAARGHRLVEPTPKDVLLGKGRVIQMHPGNVRFREFLKEYQEEFNNTPKYKRIKTPTELTRLLLMDGVRFLQKTESGDGWIQVNFAEAERKVKQLFRTRKKMKKTI